jgi:hypothetical protein
MRIEWTLVAFERAMAMEGPVVVGRAGHGADIPVGRPDEPNLSATALLLSPNVFDEGPPASGFWTLQHVNPHPLTVEVVPHDGPVTTLRYGQQTALPGPCVVRLVLSSSAPVELKVTMPQWERPVMVAAAAPSVARSGETGTLSDRLPWPERRRQAVEAVWPELAAGQRPTYKRSSAKAGEALGVTRETVDDHIETVVNELEEFGARVRGLDRLALGQWLHDHQALARQDAC